MPLSCDSLNETTFQSPFIPGPPEVRFATVVIVNGLEPSAGNTSFRRVIIFPSAESVVVTLLVRLPLLLTSTTYPEPALLQVTMAPSVESLCGLPSQIVFGPALPCRVTTYPVASVASDIVGPSYLRVAGSIFHEPFH